MNKAALQGQRQYFDMVHGVTLRAIGTFTDADLDFRATPEMRTVRELIHHIYAQERQLAEEVRFGRFGPHGDTDAERVAAEISSLTTVAKAQEFADKWHKAANEALAAMTEEELAKPVEAPYGSFPAWQYFAFTYDEHWHHRGQLYTYLRLLSKEPPMLYSY